MTMPEVLPWDPKGAPTAAFKESAWSSRMTLRVCGGAAVRWPIPARVATRIPGASYCPKLETKRRAGPGDEISQACIGHFWCRRSEAVQPLTRRARHLVAIPTT